MRHLRALHNFPLEPHTPHAKIPACSTTQTVSHSTTSTPHFLKSPPLLVPPRDPPKADEGAGPTKSARRGLHKTPLALPPLRTNPPLPHCLLPIAHCLLFPTPSSTTSSTPPSPPSTCATSTASRSRSSPTCSSRPTSSSPSYAWSASTPHAPASSGPTPSPSPSCARTTCSRTNQPPPPTPRLNAKPVPLFSLPPVAQASRLCKAIQRWLPNNTPPQPRQPPPHQRGRWIGTAGTEGAPLLLPPALPPIHPLQPPRTLPLQTKKRPGPKVRGGKRTRHNPPNQNSTRSPKAKPQSSSPRWSMSSTTGMIGENSSVNRRAS